ncbi:hypothetical protein PSE_2349 [Pseudovibrio sp. FO-BEG1]|nr:hypothetical protein PSE_2349 [Pseudovibrio sp. FO-BEG1]
MSACGVGATPACSGGSVCQHRAIENLERIEKGRG